MNKKWNVTRFEHSIDVMILLKILGRSEEEQIAGLLHDISHTAFSNVVDYVVYRKNQDYYEETYNDTIINSDIINILKKCDIKKFNKVRIVDPIVKYKHDAIYSSKINDKIKNINEKMNYISAKSICIRTEK